MAIHINAGSKIYISQTTVNPDVINAMDDAAAISFYEGIADYIEIEEVEDMGSVGDSAEDVTFVAIGNRRVRHLKGPFDAGTQTLTCGRDPLDDGQVQLAAAQRTDFDYAFKIELNDARTANHTKSTMYYAGKVMSNPTNLGNVSNVVRREFTIGIGTAVLEIASEELLVPVNVTPPTITGTAQESETLTATDGTWTNTPTSYTRQWQVNDGTGWINIVGATSSTYTVVSGDVGSTIRVLVTAVNSEGNSTPAPSAPTATVIAA